MWNFDFQWEYACNLLCQPFKIKRIIPSSLPEPVFTDRKEHLDCLVQAALKSVTRRTTSIVLLGQRRIGKAEIFKRAVNRLFFGQEYPGDIHRSVVPVYYSFQDTIPDRWDFSIEYTENIIRWYLAFRFRELTFLSDKEVTRENLLRFLKNHLGHFPELGVALNYYEGFLKKDVTLPEKAALYLPRRISDRHEATIVMFLDEFQNTRLPQISETMAPVVSERCGGNPYYITAVIQQSRELSKPINDEIVLNEILAVDLSSGFIWGELSDQVSRWIARINEYHITKWVLYLSALEEGDKIDLDRIRRQILEKEGKDVSIEVIRDVLIKLSRGDLLDYMELGGWFRKVQDPILLEFLKIWGKIEVEGGHPRDVQNTLIRKYQKIQRRMADHAGYVGEIYLAQILWNSQNKTLPGKFFHSDEDIPVPWHFSYIRHRVRLGAGADQEIDVYAAAGAEVWIAESKWWKDRKAGVHEIESLMKKAEMVKADIGDELNRLRIWIFSWSGFTGEAVVFMKENTILWSSKQSLNDLLDHIGLRRLPEIFETSGS